MLLPPGVVPELTPREDTDLLHFLGYYATDALAEHVHAQKYFTKLMRREGEDVVLSYGVQRLLSEEVESRGCPTAPQEEIFFAVYKLVEDCDAHAIDFPEDEKAPLWAVADLLDKQPHSLTKPGSELPLLRDHVNVFPIETDDEFLIVRGNMRARQWNVFLDSESDGPIFGKGARFFLPVEPLIDIPDHAVYTICH